MTTTVLIFRDGAGSYYARVWSETLERYLTSEPCRNRATAMLYGERMAEAAEASAREMVAGTSEPERSVPAGE